jgi:hypothetical protein
VPGRGERSGFGLAVADDAGNDQARIVEHRAERMAERVAELAAFVNRTRALGRRVTRNSPRKRELETEPPKARLVLTHVGIHLAVRAFEIGVGDDGRPAVSGAGHVDHVELVLLDDAIQVRVDEVLARRRAPMAEQHVLHVAELERPPQQRVVTEINLPD